VRLDKCFVCSKNSEMGAGAESPSSHDIADIARDRKGNFTADEHR
jgi:hypothetical protein